MDVTELFDVIRSSDRLFVQQLFRPLLNVYTISTVGPDGRSPARELCHVRQKRMRIRERVDFYADEADRVPVLHIQARTVFEVGGRYDVRLPDGRPIGMLQKQFARSLVRSSWQVLDLDGRELASVQEQSMFVALLRRLWDFIPFVESFPNLIPFHFDILAGGRRIGEYRRAVGLRDRYLLILDGDPQRHLDRLLAMALTIALDALQDR
ncbi:MAG TPA: hypothetical protein VKG45_16650 [Actinomycetes bacterium]|nr:hypothetical protein [Actinomycetes bacterium]